MIFLKLNVMLRHCLFFRKCLRPPVLICLLAVICHATSLKAAAAEPAASANVLPSNVHFNVKGFEVHGNSLLSTNVLAPLLSPYTGTNVTLRQVIQAAAAVHYEYCKIGFGMMSVAIARDHLTNGLVTLNVFQTDIPQVVISGKCYLRFTNSFSATPANPKEIAKARADLKTTMAELKTRAAELKVKQADTRIHVVSTNTGPRFAVEHYLVSGNTILPPRVMSQVLTNIDGAFGTNVSFDGVRAAVQQLQKAYRERGYVTVAVGLPQQKLTNATIKLQVTEGRLADINVTGNRYFSSNNVMRALPSLHTNMLLNGPVFQAELNRANANRDRQIYPVIGPGPLPGTSALMLKVKDQLPLHGKLEFNNQNSPGTPNLRMNASAEADNLWQREHSLGVQYGFSPEQYKSSQWDFYDRPAVVNYSAFYRLPLGNQTPIENIINRNPGSFGYNEATHKFSLPPPTGRSELTIYASRSTIDTGPIPLSSTMLFSTNGTSLSEQVEHEDTTRNTDIGARLSMPARVSSDFQETFSGGMDFKVYQLNSGQTNYYTYITGEKDNNAEPPIIATNTSPYYTALPYTVKKLEYVPIEARYDLRLQDPLGHAMFGLGVSANIWYSSEFSSYTNGVPQSKATGKAALQHITGSSNSSGYWVTLNPSFSQNIFIHTNWLMFIRADGQWASEPLINNEQFGIGGVNSVRGYHEGEAFGDTGWHASFEQQTPPYVIGMAYDNAPLTVRGSLYMDYGAVYLLDPQGRPGSTQLWGTGFGLTASIGSHWQSRFLVSLPLIGTSMTPRNEPYFNFGLTAQF